MGNHPLYNDYSECEVLIVKKLYMAPDADIVRFVAEEQMALDEASVVGGDVGNGDWDGTWDGFWDT